MLIQCEVGNCSCLPRISVCSGCGRVHRYIGSGNEYNVSVHDDKPITLTSFTSGTLCQGHVWQITNEDLLVDLVANLLMGKQLHVEKILASASARPPRHRENVINDAIQKLTLDGSDTPYHRDGLLFQMFSWIAAHTVKCEGSIIKAPHLVPAHKGFDGLQITVKDGLVKDVVIFEDKATDNPRDTIREQVWPEFKEFNAGRRESELQQEVTTLLSMKLDAVHDLEEAIETIFWEQSRKFRVAITADKSHLNDEGKARLFKGYDKIISNGTVDFRKAELVHISNLRTWMQQFSEKTIKKLNTYRINNNV
ncbi:hypothetical protein ACO1PK_01555 [Alishewanella sp. d11]|uniref:hypothetical protein n=1 Tax=Alishewanella sp. d11 TaxID=3414030 RepID=UPI003BF8550D